MENDSSVPYSPLTETRSLFNSPELSDVRFLVEGQTVYGHKQTLAMGSPVFRSMFYGELKEKREVIEIKDLSLVGFMNALRYIYGFEIDYPLTDLYESYMAADKYLVHRFSKVFFDYIQRKLNAESSCLIYDQLMKIGEREEISLASVRTVIIEKSQEAIESEHFKQIDQETLISLLSLDELSIDEFDLFTVVSKWVDCEVRRLGLTVNSENRRRVFEPIKGYVLFTALTPEQIANCEDVAQLLTDEESGSLLLHRLNKNRPSKVNLKTSRRVGTYCRTMNLSVNRRVSIRTVHTTYSGSATNLSLRIRDSKGVDLDLEMKSYLEVNKWSFSFEPPFIMEPGRVYTLLITGDEKLTKENLLRTWQTYEKCDGSIFYVGPSVDPEYSGHHFIHSIVTCD